MPETPAPSVNDFDALYMSAFDDIQNFFRFARRNPGVVDPEVFNDAYYERAAEALKKRIDHEMKYLHSTILT